MKREDLVNKLATFILNNLGVSAHDKANSYILFLEENGMLPPRNGVHYYCSPEWDEDELPPMTYINTEDD